MVSSTTKEGTAEMFYQDIVTANTATEDVPLWDNIRHKEIPSKRVSFASFKLTTSGGTYVFCNVNNPEIAENAVNAMRSLLKQKKLQQH